MDRIIHPSAVDIGGGRRGFRSKDTEAGQPGTVVTATHLNATQEEMISIIEKSGVVPTSGELTQLIRAIRSQAVNFRQAGGTANALTIALDPAPPSNENLAGTPLRLLTPLTNTGPVTLSVNGLPALPVERLDGQPLQRGDVPGGGITSVIATAAAFRLVGVAYSEFRRRLTNTLTVWVRTDGSDSNDGSANTAASAFGSIQGALDKVRTLYDTVGFAVLVKLGNAGTYPGTVSVPIVGSPVFIEGDVANQDSYTIASAGVAGSANVTASGGDVTVRGVRLLNNGAVSHTLGAVSGGRISVDHVTFASSVPFSLLSHISAASAGNVLIGAGCIIANDMSYAFLATSGGTVTFLPGVAVPITNGITFYRATAGAQQGGAINVSSGASVTGTITAVRFEASLNGTINTNGAGLNFFPGNAAGTETTGGRYV